MGQKLNFGSKTARLPQAGAMSICLAISLRQLLKPGADKFSLGFMSRATLRKAEQEGLANASPTSSTLRASTLGQATFFSIVMRSS